MPQLREIENQGAFIQTTDPEKEGNGPSKSNNVASSPSGEGSIDQVGGRRRKLLSFYGSFMSIVIMILMVSLDSSELGVALTVSSSSKSCPYMGAFSRLRL